MCNRDCGCSILSSYSLLDLNLYPVLLAETSAIDLKLQYNMPNGLTPRSSIFRNLTRDQKLQPLRNFISVRATPVCVWHTWHCHTEAALTRGRGDITVCVIGWHWRVCTSCRSWPVRWADFTVIFNANLDTRLKSFVNSLVQTAILV